MGSERAGTAIAPHRLIETGRAAQVVAGRQGATGAELVAAAVWAVDGPGRLAEIAPPVPVRLDVVALVAAEIESVSGIDDPFVLGALHELSLASADRRRGGVHLTPPEIATGVLDRSLDGMSTRPARVIDTACGGGAFLLAAADRLAAHTDLVGYDIDPVAAWCARLATARVGVAADVHVVDTIRAAVDPGSPADLVIGNPPFLPQRRSATARGDAERRALRARFGNLIGPYTDGAVAFLLDALERVRPGGRVALILPWSVIATRDAAAVRSHIGSVGDLVHLWAGGRGIFAGASVQVCAVVIERRVGRSPGVSVTRSRDAGFEPLGPRPIDSAVRAGNWAALLADSLGAPDGPHAGELDGRFGRVGDRAEVAAGFRDEFYAVVRNLHESPPGEVPAAPVVSSGLIDPLRSSWGRRPARMGGAVWARPAIDLGVVSEARVAAWLAARRRPKILVATQTRVIEVAVDPCGRSVPLTPVISIEPQDPGDLWHLAAVLASPTVSAWALRRTAGTALSANAIKVAARDVRDMPLPAAGADWDVGAGAARRIHDGDRGSAAWRALGEAMGRAYGAPDELVDWWLGRIPA